MRRKFLVALAVLAILGLFAVPASAQAPAPKVTISGLVDNVTSWTNNLSENDLDTTNDDDDEWYGRTRIRPDITAEVGTTKFVLGLEWDVAYGNTSPNRFGTSGGLDLNTDVAGITELKWAYVELDTPWIPGSRLRLGAQPWRATYKGGVLASGDFGGVHWTWSANPMLRLNLTYAQVEEEGTGPTIGSTTGEDMAFVGSVEVTPFKGLSIRPIYAYARYEGTTSTASRQGRGGVSTAAFALGDVESRHTLGVDARWKAGPFSIDPTAFYQFGERELGGSDQDRSAWFFDVRGGWQAGPLLVEGAVIYTTGNDAGDDVASDDLDYYEPISTDTGFYAGWAEIYALGIDYFNMLNATASGLNGGQAIGYDKYGLIRLGARASYAFTPAFTARAGTTWSWTAEEVDTDGTIAAASGITPADGSGDARFLGHEWNLGFTYRFVPNVALDGVVSYLFAGDALGNEGNDPDDIQTAALRVRFTF